MTTTTARSATAPTSSDATDSSDFRASARAWLADNVPTGPRPKDGQELVDFDVAWQRRQHAAGWAGIDWPAEFGGRGLSALEQVIWYEELARAGAPHKSVLTAGLHQIGQTLMLCGSEAHKEQYLPGILDGSTIWCQGFSEPDAGSDLASLRTSATFTDDGDLVLNGSKVWCSFGPYARMQGALVRTDPQLPRHRGLTWVIVDLTTPGITVRPIRTIDGNAEFAEVFYDDVVVPRGNVVGEVNQGWQVALSTLALERGPAFLDAKLAMLTELDRLAELAAEAGLFADRGIAREFADVRAGATAIRAMAYRLVSPGSGGVTSAAGTSFSLHCNELRQRVSGLALRMVGAGAAGGPWTDRWLNDFCATIAGGTSDIQRNVIGERVLGLPR